MTDIITEEMDFKIHFDKEGKNVTISFMLGDREMTGTLTQAASIPIMAVLLDTIGGPGWTPIELLQHHEDGSFTILPRGSEGVL